MKITQERRKITEIRYFLTTPHNLEDAYYSFPANADGTIDAEQTPESMMRSYNRLVEQGVEFELETEKRTYTEFAKGICECGETIQLFDEYLGACECPNCGRWHNLFGQEVRDPSTWRLGEDW